MLVLLLGAAALLGLSSCGGGGGGDTCPLSIDAYCQKIGGCPMTWTEAQDATSWKGPCPGSVILSRCPYVDTATLPNFDVGIVFEYDATTGALFRVESVGQNDGCYGGSGVFETCNDVTPLR